MDRDEQEKLMRMAVAAFDGGYKAVDKAFFLKVISEADAGCDVAILIGIHSLAHRAVFYLDGSSFLRMVQLSVASGDESVMEGIVVLIGQYEDHCSDRLSQEQKEELEGYKSILARDTRASILKNIEVCWKSG